MTPASEARAHALPAGAARRAREFAASGLPPVSPRPASTVVLVRDGTSGIETYVHQRQASMAFAGGMVAFPGGGVDDADTEPTPAVDGRAWAARLATTGRAATGFVNAALRETQEETGVLLTATSLLPWAHWVTPRFERLRFDTWFFVAELPPGQEPRDISGEAAAVEWVCPAEAIRRANRGTWAMLPPTWNVMDELAQFRSVRAVLGSDRRVESIMPGWLDDGLSVLTLLPGDPRYPGDDRGDMP